MVWGNLDQRNIANGIRVTWQGAAQMGPHGPLCLDSCLFRKGSFQTSRAGGLEKHVLSSFNLNWIEISPKINYVTYLQPTIPHSPVPQAHIPRSEI